MNTGLGPSGHAFHPRFRRLIERVRKAFERVNLTRFRLRRRGWELYGSCTALGRARNELHGLGLKGVLLPGSGAGGYRGLGASVGHRWGVVALCAALGSGASGPVAEAGATGAVGAQEQSVSSERFQEELVWAPIPVEVARRTLAAPPRTQVTPLDAERFELALQGASPTLGSVSIGRANRGYLFNGRLLKDGPFWTVMAPEHSWGTEETVVAIQAAIREVNQVFPDSPRLVVGHLSREHGGWLRPHHSHQSGRDVDLGFYYLHGEDWYKVGTTENFDVARNWTLLSALLKTTELEYVFVTRRLHQPLRDYAERVGEDPELVTRVFDGPPPHAQPILRHARGHETHFHVRFASPVAVENARRARAALGRRAAYSAWLYRQLKARRARTEPTTGDARR